MSAAAPVAVAPAPVAPAPVAAAPVTAINIWLKTMAGELLPLSVAPLDTLQDVVRKLPLTYPQFPVYCTKVFRLDGEEKAEKAEKEEKEEKGGEERLVEDEVLCVFVQDVFTEQTFDGSHMVVVRHPLMDVPLGVTHFLDDGLGIPGIHRKEKVVRYNIYYIEDDSPVLIPYPGCIFLAKSLGERVPFIEPLCQRQRHDVVEGIQTRISAYYATKGITVVHAREQTERYLCACGSDIQYKSIASHEKTKRHQAYLRTKSPSA